MKVRITEEARKTKKCPAIQINDVILEIDGVWKDIDERYRKIIEADERLEIFSQQVELEIEKNKQDSSNSDIGDNNENVDENKGNEDNSTPKDNIVFKYNAQLVVDTLAKHWAQAKKDINLMTNVEFLQNMLLPKVIEKNENSSLIKIIKERIEQLK